MNLTNPGELRTLLNRHGFRFSKSMGQNFLIDASVPVQIAESVHADAGCGVLEIGPGIGCLTAELCAVAGKVLAVEVDEALRPILADLLPRAAEINEIYFGAGLPTTRDVDTVRAFYDTFEIDSDGEGLPDREEAKSA